jgi:hypothetical protein
MTSHAPGKLGNLHVRLKTAHGTAMAFKGLGTLQPSPTP